MPGGLSATNSTLFASPGGRFKFTPKSGTEMPCVTSVEVIVSLTRAPCLTRTSEGVKEKRCIVICTSTTLGVGEEGETAGVADGEGTSEGEAMAEGVGEGNESLEGGKGSALLKHFLRTPSAPLVHVVPCGQSALDSQLLAGEGCGVEVGCTVAVALATTVAVADAVTLATAVAVALAMAVAVAETTGVEVVTPPMQPARIKDANSAGDSNCVDFTCNHLFVNALFKPIVL